MVSSIITPFRWYDKYYQQHRYDVECKSVCDFKLITDDSRLLPFQFKRTSSPSLLTNWILRPCCNDPETPVLNETEQKFATSWTSDGAWVTGDCGGVKAVTSQAWANKNICYESLEPNKTYTLKFNIAKFVNGTQAPSTFVLKVYVNGVLQQNYQSAGYKTLTFTTPNIPGIINICFEFSSYVADSAVTLDFVQITKAFEIVGTDIVLDASLLKLKAYVDFDLISYCGAAFTTKTTPGCYYSIIKDEGGNLFYSEVITVQSFIPEKSPHMMLEWWNTCDMTDVIYTGSNGCTYKNRLYLPDAVLTRPTYPIKEEGEEDGNQNFNATFQKWQKIVSLIGYKLPEFIVDALTAIRLHDNITYTYPAREKQLNLDSAVSVKSVEHDIQYVVNDCFANVELKMTLNDQFVDETCCRNVILASKEILFAIPEVGVEDPVNYTYALKTSGPDPDDYYIQKLQSGSFVTVGSYVAGVWTSDTIDIGALIQDDSIGSFATKGAWEVKSNGIFFCPKITSVVKTTGFKWLFIGKLIDGVFGQVQSDITGSWENVGQKFTDDQLASGVEVEIIVTPPATYNVRIRQFDLNGGVYGFSNTQSLNEP